MRCQFSPPNLKKIISMPDFLVLDMRICVALPTKIILSATISLDPRYDLSVDCYIDIAHQNLGRREECKEGSRGFQILR
jgi:hypothetical protein